MQTPRPNTSKQGSAFESVAEQFLRRQGLEIVERNVHMKFAEIDIVARDGDILCFVEVRSRSCNRFGAPEATIDFRKQGKLIKAASAYLQRLYPKIPMCRFDVIAITGSAENPQLSYYKNAFTLDSASTTRRKGSPWQAY